MPRARRTLTDSEILSMQLNTSAAKRLRGDWPAERDRRVDSVAPTAMFLWFALLACIVALAGTFLWEAMGWTEEHCGDGTNAEMRVECAQGAEGNPGGEVKDVGHGAQSGGSAGGAA